MTLWRAATTGSFPDGDQDSDLVLQHRGTNAVALAAFAAESRRAACSVAECLVQIKAIEGSTAVELKRLTELGATERCKISEEHKSGRFDRQSKVAELAISEDAKTKRLDTQAWQTVASEAIAANAQIEQARAKASSLFTWIFGAENGAFIGPALIGTLVGTAFAPASRRRSPPRTWAATVRRIFFITLLFAVPVWLVRRKFRRWGEELDAVRHAFLGAVLSAFFRAGKYARHLGIDSFPSAMKFALPDSEACSGAAVAAKTAEPGADADVVVGPRAGPSAKLENSACCGPSDPLPTDGSQELRDSLAAWGLEQYDGALRSQGYDRQLLWTLNADERITMLGSIDCKPGHRVRFHRMLDGLTPPPLGASTTSSP